MKFVLKIELEEVSNGTDYLFKISCKNKTMGFITYSSVDYPKGTSYKYYFRSNSKDYIYNDLETAVNSFRDLVYKKNKSKCKDLSVEIKYIKNDFWNTFVEKS